MTNVLRSLFVVLILGCSESQPTCRSFEVHSKQPWSGTAPNMYGVSDEDLVKQAYGHRREDYRDTIPEETRKKYVAYAKQVVVEWGENPEEVEREGRKWKCEASVVVAGHFAYVMFSPVLPISTDGAERSSGLSYTFGYELTVVFDVLDGKVVSIARGS